MLYKLFPSRHVIFLRIYTSYSYLLLALRLSIRKEYLNLCDICRLFLCKSKEYNILEMFTGDYNRYWYDCNLSYNHI